IHLVKKGFLAKYTTFGSGVIQTFSKSMFYLKSTCPFTLTRFTLSGVTCSITVQRNATGLMNSVEITVNKITTVLQDGKITVEGKAASGISSTIKVTQIARF
uniref:Uncharacterized protein n=1 Tax=Astyanax mexicanus TaxID=7994 RepID=A0A3B1IN01_ASTMX